MDHPLLSVALLWGIAVLTPGPNFLVISRFAMRGAGRDALFAVLGIAAGTALWGTAGVAGIGLMFALAPWLFATLKIVGGAYLVWLGLRLLLAARQADDSDTAEPAAGTRRGAFLRGLLTVTTNPKTGAFVASLAATALPASPGVGLAAAVVVVMVGLSLLWYGVVAWSLGRDLPRRLYARARRGVERLAGALFIGFGIRLAADR